MDRRLKVSAIVAIALLVANDCAADEVFPVVHNEPIAVRVLSGMDAQQQARARVLMVAGYTRRDLELGLWRQEALTDNSGIARLPIALGNLPLLRVEVLKRHSCAPGSSESAFSVDWIRRNGLTAANHCGTALVQGAPGVLTVFVKGGKTSPKGVKRPCLCPTQTAAKQP